MDRIRDPDILFFVPLGDWYLVEPRPDETLDQTYKRLKRRSRSYAARGQYFAVLKRESDIVWWHVERGQHTKHVRWHLTPVGDRTNLSHSATVEDLRKAKATARYLRRKGAGEFVPHLEGHTLSIRRIA